MYNFIREKQKIKEMITCTVMKIISHPSYAGGSAIQVLEIFGEIIGQEVFELEWYLYTCLDEGRYNLLIDLRQVKKIDGLGIQIFKNVISRGMQIRLFNVGPDIQRMLRISGNADFVKIYYETDCDQVISSFKKDIEEKKRIINGNIIKRCYPRIHTFFQASFQSHAGNSSTISCRANIINLSEGGVFAEILTAIDAKSGEIVRCADIEGQGLRNFEFSLNDSSETVKAQGQCVREIMNGHKAYAGIQFQDMEQEGKDKVQAYIRKAILVKD
ncbi:MAG: STAS domain-containing protein [Candidatus Jettenia sp.]|uniref:STAS domain-containing protein n=2 Tax=Candidatus Jettenia TaxID=360731 RepID=I3IGI2_9BACT|nr:MAG: STAS domain-containing protein [Candidatus Jettenia sp. AMX1]MBC6929787.1 STAS domain-containing protein [Candidatus Jettenia sp.]NUN23667.1 PilZ domain-containing protein [Candidatus Jettenia caeni]MCE7881397.1 STAS domain-containing protein [Candidatus Jettenia sp. AMX1]MCQ3927978.1 STAS domain-containing protein [Candidatus Jettenia sp.]